MNQNLPLVPLSTVSRLFSAVGTPVFGEGLLTLAISQLALSRIAAFEMSATGHALWSATAAPDAKTSYALRAIMGDYIESGLPYDPFIQGAWGGPRGAGRRLIEPASIGDAVMRRRFYDEPRIFQEVICWQRYDDRLRVICLQRCRNEGEFLPCDLESVDSISPLLIRALELHSMAINQVRPSTNEREALPVRREQVIDDIRFQIQSLQPGLTRREAEVCAGLAMGYVPSGIALHLGISENTVTTHRKRAYAKLGVSSRTELFALCARLVTNLPALVPAGRLGVDWQFR